MPETTLSALREAVDCDVILPGETGYESLRRVWNFDIDQHPSAIVRCRTAEDAAAALRWCRANGASMTSSTPGMARSTGATLGRPSAVMVAPPLASKATKGCAMTASPIH